MPKVSHMPPEHTPLPLGLSLPIAAMAVHHTLNFDQTMPPPATNLMQMTVPPALSLQLPNPPLSIFSNSALDGTTQAQVLPISTMSPTANSLTPPPSGPNSTIPVAISASPSAISQIPPPSTAAHSNIDTNCCPYWLFGLLHQY
uniref:Uncharacterized protein n=1 Tax=Romanomermis culicivorax TaxID=13658 RepID=A0A915L4T9_ROMCU